MEDIEYEYGFAYPKTDGWERGDSFDGGARYVRRVSKDEFDTHKPDGHTADGTPYWNYVRVCRPKPTKWQASD